MKTLFQKLIAISLVFALVGSTGGVSEAFLISPASRPIVQSPFQTVFAENALVGSLVNFRMSAPRIAIGHFVRELFSGFDVRPEPEAQVPQALKAMPSPGYLLVGGLLTLGLHATIAYMDGAPANGVSQACGDAFIIASAAHWSMPRLLNLYGRFIRLIDLRGRQSGGTVTYFGDGAGLRARVKNPKRGDLSNNMVRTFRFAWFLRRIERAFHFTGLKTPAAWILHGHVRFATASRSKMKESHPHQWLSTRVRDVWSIEKGVFVRNAMRVVNTISHNGDFDDIAAAWNKMSAQEKEAVENAPMLHIGNQTLTQRQAGRWLNRIFHTQINLRGDSPKIAGFIDLYHTQGEWAASVRLAWAMSRPQFPESWINLAPTGFLARWSPFKSRARFSSDAPLSEDDVTELGQTLNGYFAEAISGLLPPGLERLSELSPATRAALAHILKTKLSHDTVWGPRMGKQVDEFVQLALKSFLDNDLYTSVHEFMKLAVGSFGLVITSSKAPDHAVVSSRKQPISIGWNKENTLAAAASEPSALKLQEFDYRIDLNMSGETAEVGIDEHGVYINVYPELPATTPEELRAPVQQIPQEVLETSRVVPIRNNPMVDTLPETAEDPVGEDIKDMPKVAAKIRQSFDRTQKHTPEDPAGFNLQSAEDLSRFFISKALKKAIMRQIPLHNQSAALRDWLGPQLETIAEELRSGTLAPTLLPRKMQALTRKTQRWVSEHPKAPQDMSEEAAPIDLLVIGFEDSLWAGHQGLEDLHRMFGKTRLLNLKPESSNKILRALKDQSHRSDFQYQIPGGVVDRQTIVLVVSQSGQTFPSVNSALQLVDKLKLTNESRIFGITGEIDTPLGQVLGQKYTQNAPFSRRIILNGSGRRPAEPSSVAAMAVYQTFSELLIYLMEDTRRVFPDESFDPLGVKPTVEELQELVRERDEWVDDTLPQIIGHNASGTPVHSELRDKLGKQSTRWAMHVWDVWVGVVGSALYIAATVEFHLPTLGNLLGLVNGYRDMMDLVLYLFMGALTIWGFRAATGRSILARLGGRTLFVADIPAVYQPLEIYLSKLFSLQFKGLGIKVHGGNPADHFTPRFAHRAVRGDLVWLGLQDVNKPALAGIRADNTMSVKQFYGNTSMGTSVETLTVGRGGQVDPLFQEHLAIVPGPTSRTAEEWHGDGKLLQSLGETRFDALSRMVTGFVFGYLWVRKVTLGGRLWEYARTQGGARVFTTASPVTGAQSTLWEPLVKWGIVTERTAHRFAFLEELVFSGLFVALPLSLLPAGAVDPSRISFVVMSSLLFGFGFHRDQRLLKTGLGLLFHAGFLASGTSSLNNLLIAMGLHYVVNLFTAKTPLDPALLEKPLVTPAISAAPETAKPIVRSTYTPRPHVVSPLPEAPVPAKTVVAKRSAKPLVRSRPVRRPSVVAPPVSEQVISNTPVEPPVAVAAPVPVDSLKSPRFSKIFSIITGIIVTAVMTLFLPSKTSEPVVPAPARTVAPVTPPATPVEKPQVQEPSQVSPPVAAEPQHIFKPLPGETLLQFAQRIRASDPVLKTALKGPLVLRNGYAGPPLVKLWEVIKPQSLTEDPEQISPEDRFDLSVFYAKSPETPKAAPKTKRGATLRSFFIGWMVAGAGLLGSAASASAETLRTAAPVAARALDNGFNSIGIPLQFHFVTRGETLRQIARGAHISFAKLLELNPQFAADPDTIMAGKDMVALPGMDTMSTMIPSLPAIPSSIPVIEPSLTLWQQWSPIAIELAAIALIGTAAFWLLRRYAPSSRSVKHAIIRLLVSFQVLSPLAALAQDAPGPKSSTGASVLRQASADYDHQAELRATVDAESRSVTELATIGIGMTRQNGADLGNSLLQGIGPTASFSVPTQKAPGGAIHKRAAATAEAKSQRDQQLKKQTELLTLAGALLDYRQTQHDLLKLSSISPDENGISDSDLEARRESVNARATQALGVIQSYSDITALDDIADLSVGELVDILQSEGTPAPEISAAALATRQTLQASEVSAAGAFRSVWRKILPTQVNVTLNPFMRRPDSIQWFLGGLQPQFSWYRIDWKTESDTLTHQMEALRGARRQVYETWTTSLRELALRQREWNAIQEAAQSQEDALNAASTPEIRQEALNDQLASLSLASEQENQIAHLELKLRLAGFDADTLKTLARSSAEETEEQVAEVVKTRVDTVFQTLLQQAVEEGRLYSLTLAAHKGKAKETRALVSALQQLSELGKGSVTADLVNPMAAPATTASGEESPSAPSAISAGVIAMPILAYTSGRTGVSPDELTSEAQGPTFNFPAANLTWTLNSGKMKNATVAVQEAQAKAAEAREQIQQNAQLLTSASQIAQRQSLDQQLEAVRETRAALERADSLSPESQSLLSAKLKALDSQVRRLERQRDRLTTSDSPVDFNAFRPEAPAQEVIADFVMTARLGELKGKTAFAFAVNGYLRRARTSSFGVLEGPQLIRWIGQLFGAGRAKGLSLALQNEAALHAEKAMTETAQEKAVASNLMEQARRSEQTAKDRMDKMAETLQPSGERVEWRDLLEHLDARMAWLEASAVLGNAQLRWKAAEATHAAFETAFGVSNREASPVLKPLFKHLDEVRNLPLLSASSLDARTDKAKRNVVKRLKGYVPGLFALDASPFAARTQLDGEGILPAVYGGRFSWTMDLRNLRAQQDAVTAGLAALDREAALRDLDKGRQAIAKPLIAELLGKERTLRDQETRLTEALNTAPASTAEDRLKGAYILSKIASARQNAHHQAEELAAEVHLELSQIEPTALDKPILVMHLPGPAEQFVPQIPEPPTRAAKSGVSGLPPVINVTGFWSGLPVSTSRGLGVSLGGIPVTKNIPTGPTAKARTAAQAQLTDQMKERQFRKLDSLSNAVRSGVQAHQSAGAALSQAEGALAGTLKAVQEGALDQADLGPVMDRYLESLDQRVLQLGETEKFSTELRLAMGHHPESLMKGTLPQSPLITAVNLDVPAPVIPTLDMDQLQTQQKYRALSRSLTGGTESASALQAFLTSAHVDQTDPQMLVALTQAVRLDERDQTPRERGEAFLNNLKLAALVIQTDAEVRRQPAPTLAQAMDEALRSYKNSRGRLALILTQTRTLATPEGLEAGRAIASWIPDSDGLSVLVRLAARQKFAQEKSKTRLPATVAARQVQIASGILRLAADQMSSDVSAPSKQALALNAMDQAVRLRAASATGSSQLRAALARAAGNLIKPLAPTSVIAANRSTAAPRAPKVTKPLYPNLKRSDRATAAPRLYPNLPRGTSKLKSSPGTPATTPSAVPKKMSSVAPRGTLSFASFSFFAFAWITPLFSWRRLFARRTAGERALQSAA